MITGSYGPLSGSLAYTFTHFDPILGIVDEPAGDHPLAGAAADRPLERAGHDALRPRCAGSASRTSIQLKYADECFVLTASYIETFVENTALDLQA